MKCIIEDVTSWKNNCSNRPYNFRFKSDYWISQIGVDYHEVIGIVDKNNNLLVWDMGIIIPYKAYNGDNNGIISIKLTSYNDNNDDKDDIIVSWDGFSINSNSWIKIPIDQSNNNVQTNIVGSVYIYIKDQESNHNSNNNNNHNNNHNNNYNISPIVIASGVVNGTNPCPGVAVARYCYY
jgi:hypothetical protein